MFLRHISWFRNGFANEVYPILWLLNGFAKKDYLINFNFVGHKLDGVVILGGS